MGLESTSYVTGLNEAWPAGSERKSQGDDHLRLIKNVLKQTFPNATHPYYFPDTNIITGDTTLGASAQNSLVLVSTASGNINVALPTLSSGDKGFWIDVIKTTNDANAALVYSGSGNISSRCGSTALIRVGCSYDPARFLWTGSFWACFKNGLPIGTVVSYDATTIPAGYLECDASSFSPTGFPELYNIIGGTLPDRRGRVDVGPDASNVRMNASAFGNPVTLGNASTGDGRVTIDVLNLPPYTPAGTVATTLTNTHSVLSDGGAVTSATAGSAVYGWASLPTNGILPLSVSSSFSGTAQGGTSTPLKVVQPSLVTHRIIRAC